MRSRVTADNLHKGSGSLKVGDKLGSGLGVSTGSGAESEAAEAKLHHPGGRATTKTTQATDEQVGRVGVELKLSTGKQGLDGLLGVAVGDIRLDSAKGIRVGSDSLTKVSQVDDLSGARGGERLLSNVDNGGQKSSQQLGLSTQSLDDVEGQVARAAPDGEDDTAEVILAITVNKAAGRNNGMPCLMSTVGVNTASAKDDISTMAVGELVELLRNQAVGGLEDVRSLETEPLLQDLGLLVSLGHGIGSGTLELSDLDGGSAGEARVV